MTKQEMVDKIYEVVADKTLSFGCRCVVTHDETEGTEGRMGDIVDLNVRLANEPWINHRGTKMVDCTSFGCGSNRSNYDQYAWRFYGSEIDNAKIIGHPVMVGDILEYINKNKRFFMMTVIIHRFWGDFRLPIEDQSKECVQYIYNIIK